MLPDYVSSAINRLKNAGYEAYAVGGCIRDAIMRKEPHDYDICTDAEPQEIKRIFTDSITVDTGIKHGTVTVISEGRSIEITAFRSESSYSDGRHPDSVSFTKNLFDDLARRDFTVNALAYSDETGMIDVFGGAKDISDKMIRCIGEPKKRFGEDYLRILRAIRFSSVLGFEIEPNTSDAMLDMRENLKRIAPERIAAELKKTVCGSSFEQVFMKYTEIFTTVIPELKPCVGFNQKNPHHRFELHTHLAKTVSASPVNYISRLAALFHDIGKPSVLSYDESGIAHYYSHASVSSEISEKILRRLHFSNLEISKITTLIRYHDGVIEESEKAVKRRLNKLGEEAFFDLVALQRADNAAQTEDSCFRSAHSDKLCQIAGDIISKSECVSLNRLAVNGYDMLSLGLCGKSIGDALSFLLDSVMNGEIANEKEALLQYWEKNRNRSSPS